MRELDEIRRLTGRCPTGSAVVTSAGNLPARYVFHAVGPVYRDGRHGEPELLASCYRKCFALAEDRAVRTISFPAISTGVYGYPMEEAARIAIGEVRAHLEKPGAGIERVVFVVFGKAAFETYGRILGST
jgi:O-acetyl-ADP-ribose deacetylase (regulator of RNase III)